MSDRAANNWERKFKRAVVLNGSGMIAQHITSDCNDALNQIGVMSFELYVKWLADQTFDSVCGNVKEFLDEVKPDFIFVIDAGLVRDAPDFFASTNIPVVSWFVDDPFMFLNPDNVFDRLFAFTWDRAYIEPLLEIGCGFAGHLPLGTNPNRFRRVPQSDPRHDRYCCDVSFVGSSLAHHSTDNFAKTHHDPLLLEILDECITRHALPPHTPVADLLAEIEKRNDVVITAEDRFNLEFDIALVAMRLFHANALGRLAGFAPHVYGDDGWLSLLAPGPVYRGPIDYTGDLHVLYSASSINLNLSKSQLKTSVNQRVFDAPACGGFVLTDYREDAERLFDPDTELALFHDLEEMEAKTAYFLENSEERESRARKTKRRVLSEHTYAHRMRRMLQLLAESI
jgi:spore maturation protein CgeB